MLRFDPAELAIHHAKHGADSPAATDREYERLAERFLGAGFLEKVQQRALLRELSLRGIRAAAEASFAITYKGHSVGEYYADLLVEDVLVVGLKCAERLANERRPQPLRLGLQWRLSVQ